jgi:hypothetical protein
MSRVASPLGRHRAGYRSWLSRGMSDNYAVIHFRRCWWAMLGPPGHTHYTCTTSPAEG